MTMRRRSLMAGTMGTLVWSQTQATETPAELIGAGGSTISPIMKGWLEQTKTLGLNVTYSAIGSPAGTTRILAGSTDFAVLEIPLTNEQLISSNLYQFPLAFASIVFVANVPGVGNNQLSLTGQLLGGIYRGAIKKWNDPKIAAANPGLALPDLDISPINHAVPNSAMLGDTIGVVSYLLSANADWREKFGDTLPKRWAVGSMSATGETMTETIRSLQGSIGYLPAGAAVAAKVPMVRKLDDKGATVEANAASLKAAVAAVNWSNSENLVQKLVDLPGDGVWPVVIASYGVLSRDYKKKRNGAALQSFFKFVLTEGADIARKRGGEPAPLAVQSRVLGQLDKFQA